MQRPPGVSKGLSGAVFGVLLFIVIFLVPHGARQVAFVAREPDRQDQEKLETRRRSYAFHTTRVAAFSTAVIAFAALSGSALAQKKYDPGASDTEIKIGNIMPYSGPASAYGMIGKAEAAYFRMINDKGGINGRKFTFITYDDGYSPPKAVEQVRKLVESDEVLLVFGTLGTPSNTAIHKYLNAKKVPQLFVASGATKWGRPAEFPWTMGWQPSYQAEARIFAKYLLQKSPSQNRGALSERRFRQGPAAGPEGRARRPGVDDRAEESYEVSEPSIDAISSSCRRPAPMS